MYTASRIGGVLLALSLAILAVPDSNRAVAQEPAPLKIAVLDAQLLMRDSKAAKVLQAELKKRRAAYEAELIKKEKALIQASQKLASERSTLSQTDFDKRRKELEAQAEQFRNDAQVRRQQFEKLESEGSSQIRKAIVEIVAEMAKANGITLVLDKSQILLSVSAYEITAETLKKLDVKLPTVNLAQQ